jgi:predicted RNase H-like nuclease (RuvC/YqgF family)
MAKNETRDTERLQMMQLNNKELNSAVSRIQSNNKELNSAVSRMQFQISRLKRKKKRVKSPDLASGPAPVKRSAGRRWRKDGGRIVPA